ncbi:uncharacterized protein LOC122299618 [Carya illinoinensis]|uniref:uncharacterized protein LOC122299618 n=1 Tax=Carya illinoinensis TaxID=32201 RepID=UPI001C728A40|nr:uncharacterized protein LOC122299618 [Carya illinoinensis]
MRRFREALEEGGLFDLGWKGDKYTWSNKHEDDTFTKERLDRAVANLKWKGIYKEAWVEVLAARCSDHRPLLLHTNQEPARVWRGKRLFIYEAKWSLEEDCEQVIKRAWQVRVTDKESGRGLQRLLESSKGALMQWSKLIENDRRRDLKDRTELLKKLQEDEGCHNSKEIKQVQAEIGVCLEMEDLKWRQRAKVDWYKLGDRNTQFFHSCANQRRKTNSIKYIFDGQNVRHTNHTQIELIFNSYFQDLFTSSRPSSEDIEECLKGVETYVTAEMNSYLTKQFTRIEVEAAIKQMAPLKSPGPDGFGACFFQKYWQVVGDEVSKTVLDWLNGNSLIPSMNYTYIALIPKVKEPRMASDYRPISLCNVVYKIMSKALANRLKKFMNNVVSPNQSAFIRGRLITDNIMIAYEMIAFYLEELKQKNGGKIQELLLTYEKALGQFLNKEKTTVFFSTNSRTEEQKKIKELGGNVMRGSYEKYLGLPPVVGKLKYNSFRSIKGRVWKRISNWKNSFLSLAGKEVLIKAVLQSVPTYTMRVFKIPKNLYKELNSLMAKFWWGNPSKSNGIHWCCWEKLGRPKGRGGLGFRDLESFNLALLAKQAWRFLQNPRSLVANIFKEKYYRSGSLLEAKLGHRPSYIWRSVWGALNLLKEGLRWRVGNDKSIRIWKQKWLLTPSTHCVQAPISVLDERARVSELVSNGEWDVQLLKNIFRQEEVEQICSIPISKSNAEDKLIWGCTTTGFFTIRSAYQLEMSRNEVAKGENSKRREGDNRWQSIWDLNIQEKVKLFMWRAMKSLLATRSNLVMRKIIDNSKCPICKAEEETTSHALWSCPAAIDVWAESLKVTQKWKSEETDLRSERRNVRWSRPREQAVKANWDAAVDKKEGKVGIGVVIRDEEGEVLVATGEQMNYMTDAAIAESFALRKALEVCRDLNFNNVWFEGDAQNIVNAVNTETEDMSRYGSVIEDVKNLLKGRKKWRVSFVFREANEAAHVLARDVLFFQSEIVWIEDAPDCIRGIIGKEKSCSENIVQ